MEIDGPQLAELQAALIDAYPTRLDLEQMVLFRLNERLSTLVAEGSLKHMVFELLQWAEAHGRLEQLVLAALQQNPQNPQLLRVTGLLGLSHDRTSSSDVGALAGQRISHKPQRFPEIWNVPYRYAAFFTGRDQVLEQLFANFDSGRASAQALTGMGGCGKTQTAVAYAYRYRKHYQKVLWIRAETEADLVAHFTIAADLLKRPVSRRPQRESLLESMRDWFKDTTDWLLILDNADDLALVDPFVPKARRGHVLLTSREIAMGEIAQPLALVPLRPDDGALCILRRANFIPWTAELCDASKAAVKAAQELSELMNGLPLALEQAGAYIETTGRSVSGYLKLYSRYRAEIQREWYGVVRNYPESVACAWNIAREAVRQENPAAIELLHLCAYLAPNAIPYELFTYGAPALGSTLGPVAANEPALDRAIALLRKHSLIKNEVDRDTDISRIVIHPVLQEVLKDDMDMQAQCLWAQRAVQVVASALRVVPRQVMQAHVHRCLLLIEKWKMSIRSADLICQYAATERIE